jgi:nucleotide-binding universal stress UspA family protein
MYQRILVPLDGSKRAERIMPHVEKLAQSLESTLILLRVAEPSDNIVAPHGSQADMYIQSLERWAEEARGYLKGIQGEFRQKGIKARILVEKGPVVNAIINAAIREEADLIAIASHGRSGLSRAFYGSVAAGVLQKVDRPLLVIRARG